MYLLLVCAFLLLDALITFPEEVSEKDVFSIFNENRQVGDCAKTYLYFRDRFWRRQRIGLI